MDDKVIKFLESKKWSLPYNESDLLDAIQLGRDLTIEEIRGKLIGIPVNGVIQSVLLEEAFKEITNGR